MLEQPKAIFLINLLQDVNVLRPLIVMATRDFGFRALLLASPKFAVRDSGGIWQDELETISNQAGAELRFYESDRDASRHLTGSGIIFAGSESGLRAHEATHALFRYAPPTFLKVTLQHGLECVGFRHSDAHDFAYGHSVGFGADLLCTWQPQHFQSSMSRSQRPKAVLTGPTAVLQAFDGPFEREAGAPGLVCENLHSVRLNAPQDLKQQFVGAFTQFCALAPAQKVVLRPHPGGQYSLKNNVELPPNASIENAPIYRVDLRRFAFGISAPSSVILDMVLAGIPTAVWRDREGEVDSGNYSGLAIVSSPAEWADFAREASARPEQFQERQRTFLESQQIPTDPRVVFDNFARIFAAGARLRESNGVRAVERQRLLLVANAHLPTVEVCFERPLSSLVRTGELATELLTEERLRRQRGVLGSDEAVVEWLHGELAQFAPQAIVFSRYSGPFGEAILSWARSGGVATIYHIDDDLLSVPKSIGEKKHAYHNAPERLESVRALMGAVDLVYASTEALRRRLLELCPGVPAVTGAINCSGEIIRRPARGAARVVGYMASADHLPNLEMILPAIVQLLTRHPELNFELFGSIPKPPELDQFGERVVILAPVSPYEDFLEALAARAWDIGVCPLVPTAFNRTKSNNKWVEYTSAGIAAVASRGMVYDECCADGCGILAETGEEWLQGLELLVGSEEQRLATVERAQSKLARVYSVEQHRHQILGVIAEAKDRARGKGQAAGEATMEQE